MTEYLVKWRDKDGIYHDSIFVAFSLFEVRNQYQYLIDDGGKIINVSVVSH